MTDILKTENLLKVDISNIEKLLKVLTDVSEWAKDLQNNMDRLREDLDELCSAIDLKKTDKDDDSDSNGSDDESNNSNSNNSYPNIALRQRF